MFIATLCQLDKSLEKPIPRITTGAFLTSTIAISIVLGILATMNYLPSYIGTAAWSVEGVSLIALALYGIKSFCQVETKKIEKEESLAPRTESKEFADWTYELLQAPVFLRDTFGGHQGPQLSDSSEDFKKKLSAIITWINDKGIEMPDSCPEFRILKNCLEKKANTNYGDESMKEMLQYKYQQVFEKLGPAYANHIYLQQERLVDALIRECSDHMDDADKEKENPTALIRPPYPLSQDEWWIYLSFDTSQEESGAETTSSEIYLRFSPGYTLDALRHLIEVMDNHPDIKANIGEIKINRYPTPNYKQEEPSPTIVIELKGKKSTESWLGQFEEAFHMPEAGLEILSN